MTGPMTAGGTGDGATSTAASKQERRGEALADRILAWSLQAGVGSSGRLPTERQLSQDLGVSRAAIRHALGIMEARGHISREVGRGTYLKPSAPRPAPAHDGAASDRWPGTAGPHGPASLADPHGLTSLADPHALAPLATAITQPDGPQPVFAPADVMLVRRLLEPPAMPLAVAWAIASDFAEMDRCLEGGDKAASYEEFEAWDLALHRGIMVATHSPLLVTLYASVAAARRGQMWGDLKRRSATAERRCLYQEDHHAIVGALKSRDANGAVRAMRDHLARVSDHLNATDPAAGVWH